MGAVPLHLEKATFPWRSACCPSVTPPGITSQLSSTPVPASHSLVKMHHHPHPPICAPPPKHLPPPLSQEEYRHIRSALHCCSPTPYCPPHTHLPYQEEYRHIRSAFKGFAVELYDRKDVSACEPLLASRALTLTSFLLERGGAVGGAAPPRPLSSGRSRPPRPLSSQVVRREGPAISAMSESREFACKQGSVHSTQ